LNLPKSPGQPGKTPPPHTPEIVPDPSQIRACRVTASISPPIPTNYLGGLLAAIDHAVSRPDSVFGGQTLSIAHWLGHLPCTTQKSNSGPGFDSPQF